jgi:hypothetical protein
MLRILRCCLCLYLCYLTTCICYAFSLFSRSHVLMQAAVVQFKLNYKFSVPRKHYKDKSITRISKMFVNAVKIGVKLFPTEFQRTLSVAYF